MYWIPVFFLIIEMLYILNLNRVISLISANYILSKYKSEELSSYIKENYKDTSKFLIFFAFGILFEILYFIIGLFYPIWMISVIFIIWLIIENISSKITKSDKSIEKYVKMAELENFNSNDIKLNRILKLQELEGNNIKTSKLKYYIIPLIKILVFIGIIVLHYHFKLI